MTWSSPNLSHKTRSFSHEICKISLSLSLTLTLYACVYLLVGISLSLGDSSCNQSPFFSGHLSCYHVLADDSSCHKKTFPKIIAAGWGFLHSSDAPTCLAISHAPVCIRVLLSFCVCLFVHVFVHIFICTFLPFRPA